MVRVGTRDVALSSNFAIGAYCRPLECRWSGILPIHCCRWAVSQGPNTFSTTLEETLYSSMSYNASANILGLKM